MESFLIIKDLFILKLNGVSVPILILTLSDNVTSAFGKSPDNPDVFISISRGRYVFHSVFNVAREAYNPSDNFTVSFSIAGLLILYLPVAYLKLSD